jgi:hypothetical protein
MKPLILSVLVAVALTACTNYGPKVKKDYLEVYYKEGISKDMAQKTLDFIYPLWKKETGVTEKKSIQLVKGEGDTINFRAVTDEKKLKESTDDIFYEMANIFSDSIYGGAPVNMVFTNNAFKSIRTLVFRKKVAPVKDNSLANASKDDFDHGTAAGIDFYWKGISDEESKTIADYIVKNGAFSGGSAEIYMTKEGDRYFLRFPMKEEAINDASYFTALDKVTKEIKDNVFANVPFSFLVTDTHMTTVKSWDY